jgi:hypothetical protein
MGPQRGGLAAARGAAVVLSSPAWRGWGQPCGLALCEACQLSLRHPGQTVRACRPGRSPRISPAWGHEEVAHGSTEAWLKPPSPEAAHVMQDAEMGRVRVPEPHQGCGLVTDRASVGAAGAAAEDPAALRGVPAQQDIAPPLPRSCSTGVRRRVRPRRAQTVRRCCRRHNALETRQAARGGEAANHTLERRKVL